MTLPQQKPQHEDIMAEEIDRVLREGLAAPRQVQPRPVDRPPASTAGPRPPEKWGPNTPRASPMPTGFVTSPPPDDFEPPRRTITSPLELLGQVAENTTALHEQLTALVTAITGEQPPPKRIRQVPRKGSGLLPAISHLAHEIDAAHSELARLINHVARQL